MKPYLLVGLGLNDEFLGVLSQYETEEEADAGIEALFPLIMANLEGLLPLKQRIALAPRYFPYAGALVSIDVVDLRIDCLFRL